MSKKSTTRLCWNCHGEVSYHLNQCPYCGLSITPYTEETQQIPSPPYSRHSMETEENLSENPYELTQEEWNEALSEETPSEQPVTNNSSDSLKAIFPFTYIFIGTLLGLMSGLILFSTQEEYFLLAWSKKTALLYLGIGVPLWLFGVMQISRKK